MNNGINANAVLELGVAGRFKIEAARLDESGQEIAGSRRLAADWFDNLVVDAGLNRMGGFDGCLDFAMVGSGNAAPLPSNTTLQSRVGSTSTKTSNVNGSNASPRYGWRRITFRFAAGAAAGNLSEVGVGWDSTNITSRALILDGSGNPTTITVLPDEILDVTYEFRVYFSEADSSFNVTISGVTYACVLRPAIVNDSTYGIQYGNVISVNSFNGAIAPRAFETDVLGAITGQPAGSGSTLSLSNAPYVAGNFYSDCTITADLNIANFTTGIGSLRIDNTLAKYQVSFSPKIPKDATKKLTLSVRTTWSRHVP
ncbi:MULTISPECIES: hypothetical protein [unclassified Stenotrophomonas]|uniref:hypothetical protein n=1 Tax=unclassified Stenotrophomonas TaxID=196198 RepID=UPI0024498B5B|nr:MULTISPECIES: hypothetical protein [unclassified Stenotrophomonas]MDH0276395.1 hypothetical protein [Stenotrophomonas sp. GD04089]MDH1911531.1 hypothetical protein [Stenotrophomonas sp. GD03794]